MTSAASASSSSSELSVFDLADTLPRSGVTMIEASAGTGKTFALESLVARYVVEYDIDMSEVLLVTFTNSAAADLRHRVRTRLRTLADALAESPPAESTPPTTNGQAADDVGSASDDVGSASDDVGSASDDVGSASGDADDPLLPLFDRLDAAETRRRVGRALADFDQASVTTIHSFCQQVLTGAGVCGVPGLTLRPDLGTLELEVVTDQLASAAIAAAPDQAGALPCAKDMAEGLRRARNHPGITLLPGADSLQDRIHKLDSIVALVSASTERLLAKNEDGKRANELWRDAGDGSVKTVTSLRDQAGRARDLRDRLNQSLALAEGVGQSERRLEAVLDRRGQAGFGDVLTRARDLVVGSPTVRDHLRRRFRLILVDEFQDTDPVQWSMLRALVAERPRRESAASPDADTAVSPTNVNDASASPRTNMSQTDMSKTGMSKTDMAKADTSQPDLSSAAMADASKPSPARTSDDGVRAMVLVGDPKQAIYRFRGGDIHTYRAARDRADNTVGLATNYRSQRPLIEALNHLLDGSTLGPGIHYRSILAHHEPVAPSPGIAADPPLTVRLLPMAKTVGATEEACAKDVARQVFRALHHPDEAQRVKPSGVAVLYRAHAHAGPILRELKRLGIPAVQSQGESVLDSPAVNDWRVLLWAADKPSDPSRARRAALTPLLQVVPHALLDDDTVHELQSRFRELATALEDHGVAYATRKILDAWEVALRLARTPDGDRTLVDFEHLGELLHHMTGGDRMSPAAALEHLEELVRGNPVFDPDGEDLTAEIAKRRLDTEIDDDVVRLMTIHASKGLEFDLVCAPSLWRQAQTPQSPFHHLGIDDSPVLQFGKDSTADGFAAAGREALEEERRLAYVALTRARSRVLVWWPGQPSDNSDNSDNADKPDKPDEAETGFSALLGSNPDRFSDTCQSTAARLTHLASSCGVISLERVPVDQEISALAAEIPPVPPPGEAPSASLHYPQPLAPAGLDRTLDRSFGRLSFSRISNAVAPYEDRRLSAVDPGLSPDLRADDENPDEINDPVTVATDAEVELAALPVGKFAGTRMHQVFEDLDFSLPAVQLHDEIERLTAVHFPRLAPETAKRVARGLFNAVGVSLGAAVEDASLASINRLDRIDEMQFDIPLATGRGNAATLPELSSLLLSCLPVDTADGAQESEADRARATALRTWAEGIGNPARPLQLGGFLTGSIDLLFRQPVGAVGDRGGHHRYVVVDYKSNKVARWPEPMTPDAYGQERLLNEMVHGQYLLQALLYLVATNRFLKQRLENYDPDIHLGPALYLFVRGMTGHREANCVAPNGVFSWRPSTGLIEATDALLCRSGAC